MKNHKNIIYLLIGTMLVLISYGASHVFPVGFYTLLEYLASIVMLGIVLIGIGNVIIGKKDKKNPTVDYAKQRNELISASTDMFFILLPMLVVIVYNYVSH